jgi:precorrin-4/cobalt-precorrin-4 C11-methyltransferase
MIYFIGAGPGDPDLITLKGKKIIEKSKVIIYTGSLVNKEILKWADNDAKIYNSASMNLDEIIKVMEKSVNEGKLVARIHTGDPSIYGAIREQMDILDNKNILYEIVPGVSSFLAGAARLKKEYTLPGVTQTVILTRIEGRTKVPKLESIEELAKHKSTMVIFLSISMIDKLVEKLKTSYDEKTPIAVLYKVTWNDEKIIRGNLLDIVDKVKATNIKKTALIVVGDFLGDDYELSKLYDKNFSHEYRK